MVEIIRSVWRTLMPTLEQQLQQIKTTVQAGIDLLTIPKNLIAVTTGKSAAVFEAHTHAVMWSKKCLNTMSRELKSCETLLRGSADDRDLARIEIIKILDVGLKYLTKKADGLVNEVRNPINKEVFSQLQEVLVSLRHEASKGFKL